MREKFTADRGSIAASIRNHYVILSLTGFLVSHTEATFGHEHVHIRVHVPEITNQIHHKQKILVKQIPVIHQYKESLHLEEDNFYEPSQRDDFSSDGIANIDYGVVHRAKNDYFHKDDRINTNNNADENYYDYSFDTDSSYGQMKTAARIPFDMDGLDLNNNHHQHQHHQTSGGNIFRTNIRALSRNKYQNIIKPPHTSGIRHLSSANANRGKYEYNDLSLYEEYNSDGNDASWSTMSDYGHTGVGNYI